MACDCCDDNSIELPIGPTGDDGVSGNYVVATIEPAGANCANGGFKMQILSGDTGAVLNTGYVCNGVDGLNGANGVDGTNSIGQNVIGINSTPSVFQAYANNVANNSPLISISLPAAGTYLITLDAQCMQGTSTNWALYEDNSQSFGFAEFRYQVNGSVNNTFSASNISQSIPDSVVYPYTPVVAGAVNSPYYKLLQTKQTTSKTFFYVTTGAETISAYIWLATNLTATVSKPASMYTYNISLNALKIG